MKKFKLDRSIFKVLLLIPALLVVLWGLSFIIPPFNTVEPTEYEEAYVEMIDGYTPFEISFLYFGEKEVTGKGSNSTILSFFDGLANWVSDDETPWCSAFMNYTHAKAGYLYTGSLSARSWLDYGFPITNPKPGDVTILWRESRSSWKGHVAYFVRYNEDKSKVLLYGGNQYNMITLSWYPSYRVLGFRQSEIDMHIDERDGFTQFIMEPDTIN